MTISVINDCLKKGVDFTQETTLSGVRIERTVKAAREKGYCIRLFYVGLDTLEESLKRIRNRVEKGGHNISEIDVTRRFTDRFKSLKRILPYCNEGYFFDNDNGFYKVAEYHSGVIIPLVEDYPLWLIELMGSNC